MKQKNNLGQQTYNEEQQEFMDQRTKAMIMFDECEDISTLNIPKQYFHDPTIQDDYGYTMAFRYAMKGIIPPVQWNHDPNMLFRIDERDFDLKFDYYYCYSMLTIGMILARKNIIPPKQWIEDYKTYGVQVYQQSSFDIEDYIQLKDILYEKQLPIPRHIKDEELTIFDQAYYRIVPDIINHKPEEQDEDGFTVAMILAINNIEIPKEWYHNPNIQNKYRQTVALIQASRGIIPDKQWIHNKFFRGQMKIYQENKSIIYTIQNLLQSKNIKVPEEWKYNNIVDNKDNTQAMIQAKQGIIPDQKYYHNPIQSNICGCTVAMLLALADRQIPKEWEHDPKIKCGVGQTVGTIMSQYGEIPPQQWMVTEQMDKQIFDKIVSNLNHYDYVYVNNQFKQNWKVQILNDICQVCLNEGKQQFLKTICKHKICLQCFEILKNQEKCEYCPVCRQENWYEKYY